MPIAFPAHSGEERDCGCPTGSQITGQSPEFRAQFSQFFRDWRIKTLAAPQLPWPLGWQCPAPVMDDSRELLASCGVTVFIPDTNPLPDRDQLRLLVADARGASQDREHLRDWLELVDSGNKSKTGLERYRRVFLIQLFSKLLYHAPRRQFDQKEIFVDSSIRRVPRCVS